jgi:simple sugar transport system ATP-binding protein
MRYDGRRVRMGSAREARALGIAVVFQHFSLFESMSVAQNVWLGQGRGSSLESVSRELERLGAELGMTVDGERAVRSLSVGERQRA